MLRSGLWTARRHTPPEGTAVSATLLLLRGRELEQAGELRSAAGCFQEAIDSARATGDAAVLSEALRRLAVLRYHGNDAAAARELAGRSYRVALGAGKAILAAEALNTLATVDLQTGELDRARETYEGAMGIAGADRRLGARIAQNLGVIANIHGDHDEAEAQYRESLDACTDIGDEHGRAIALHNLGMVAADRERWDEADTCYTQSRAIAERCGDRHLLALCLVNHAEVDLARQQYDRARDKAEAALAIFGQLDVKAARGDAYRMIGMVYRDTGRLELAEARLRSAMDLAESAGSLLGQAETSRELGRLYQAMGRNQEALSLLHASYRYFNRLDARVDLVNVGGKVAALERTYLAVVRTWGQSIESSDSYTHGHCERVADYAVRVGRALGLSADELKTIRIGAYLHDVGKVKVPHEILNKPGPLTNEEFEVMQMHTVWGEQLLEGVEFPWDIKPIIRHHHEKHDGAGYPDRLAGEEIPLSAQIIGISDVFDALTTTRAYRPAMSHDEAVAEIRKCRHWWRARVVDAFLAAVAEVAGREAAA